MTAAAGRSRLSLILAPLLVGVVVLLGGPAHAQTNTTAPPVTTAAPAPSVPAPSTTAVSAGDEASTRTVNRIIAVLIVLAVVLVGVAIWFWRATKPVARHLDGLDLMGTRRWRKGGPAERATLLAPVHERRAEPVDDEVAAPPEPTTVTAEAEAAEAAEVAEAEVAEVADDEAAEEPTPRAS